MKREWGWLGVLGGGLSSLAGLIGTACVACAPVCGSACGAACATGAGYVISGFLGFGFASILKKYSPWLIALGILCLARGIMALRKDKAVKENPKGDGCCHSTLKSERSDDCITDCCGNVYSKENIVFRSVPKIGTIAASRGEIPVVSPDWSFQDFLGTIGVRLDINRMNYAVEPGLYAMGNPQATSPIFVSANYKLSFDSLRRELKGIDNWLLVIDTNGINVWCAAGKGTFGTAELIQRISLTGLSEIVTTRKLIVPQLGGPGVEAHKVREASGFSVIYGPVRASDIPAFLEAGWKATPEMRKVMFPAIDRCIISLTDLVQALNKGLVGTFLLLVGSFFWPHQTLVIAFRHFGILTGVLWSAILTGTILQAILLPFLPGRAFSVRGGFLGLVMSGFISILGNSTGFFPHSLPGFVSLALGFSGLSAYLSLNFTGASTFTSHSGVKKEVACAIPIISAMLALSMLVLVLNLIVRRV